MEVNYTKEKAKIINFLTQFIPDFEQDDKRDIIDTGLVNSLFAMQLILYIESDFGIELDNDDISRDAFHNVESILQIINDKISKQERS